MGQLVLSRKAGQTLELFVPGFDPIVIQIVDIRGDKARVGINADRRIAVHRSEVARAIEARKKYGDGNGF